MQQVGQQVGGGFEGEALLAGSFAAADGLAANLATRMPHGTRMLAATFVDRDAFDRSSAFGRLVSAQVVSRLVQGGYDVVEIRLRRELGIREGQGEFALTRQTAQLMQEKFDAQALLVGCYTVDARNVFVSVRVVRLEDGVQVSAFDWALPKKGVVARLLAPESSEDVFESYLNPQGRMVAGGMPAMAEPLRMPTRMDAPQPVIEQPLPQGAPTQGEVFRLFPPTRIQ
nr:FlgO family outer membrane protein [Desulfobaculum xiamenense]